MQSLVCGRYYKFGGSLRGLCAFPKKILNHAQYTQNMQNTVLSWPSFTKGELEGAEGQSDFDTDLVHGSIVFDVVCTKGMKYTLF